MGNNIDEKKHKFGWIPDKPDQRDKCYSSYRAGFLPKVVDLRSGCSKVSDQLTLGCCTACSGVGALEYLEIKDGIKLFYPLSVLFLYYNTRLLEHCVNYDSGSSIRDTIKSMVKYGVCIEEYCKFNPKRYKNRPSQNSYINALKHQVIEYKKLLTLTDLKQCLAEGFPFIFGFSVYESFESDFVAKTGIVNIPLTSESCIGGHAVVAVGYNDTEQRFIVRNSWGSDWGDKGYFHMPYKYLSDRTLSDDFWTIRQCEEI